MSNDKWWTPEEEARARRARWECQYSEFLAGWLWHSPWEDAGLLGHGCLRVAAAVPHTWWDRRGRSHSFVPDVGVLTVVLDACGEAP